MSVQMQRRLFTVQEYHLMGEAGILGEDDRNVKVPNYARSGIQEVWLWDLAANCLEVYREPTVNGYSFMQKFAREERVSPLAFPDFELSVNLILG